jgi:hypothetical protein
MVALLLVANIPVGCICGLGRNPRRRSQSPSDARVRRWVSCWACTRRGHGAIIPPFAPNRPGVRIATQIPEESTTATTRDRIRSRRIIVRTAAQNECAAEHERPPGWHGPHRDAAAAQPPGTPLRRLTPLCGGGVEGDVGEGVQARFDGRNGLLSGAPKARQALRMASIRPGESLMVVMPG